MTNSLLSILAHPDDESFGSGGTYARYAAEGVDVHICIATDGAAGSVAKGHEDAHDKLAQVREIELEEAVKVLGGTLHRLDYRDSGMAGSASNQHPDAFVNADKKEAIGRIVRLIRQIQPTIVITHDETGGYFHPDHIQCWALVTPAFIAAADPDQYPEFGLAPWSAERLYYTAMPDSAIKFYRIIMRLRGQNPAKAGRNKDIDLTRIGIPKNKIHARINYRDYWDVKVKASAAHASQGGGTSRSRLFPQWAQKRFFAYDNYIRAMPLASDGTRETTLFPNNN